MPQGKEPYTLCLVFTNATLQRSLSLSPLSLSLSLSLTTTAKLEYLCQFNIPNKTKLQVVSP